MNPSSIVRRARRVFAVLGLALPLIASAGQSTTFFAKGGDVSWVTQQEAVGQHFYDGSMTQKDPYVLLKAKGINSVRLRVWVNPTDGWCNAADVLVKAQRAKAQGMSIMIDFHYSDTWADPGNQTKPAAWANYTNDQLTTAVYNHTYNTLNYLKSNGITVKWVQVGNEIVGGMLWPNGLTYAKDGYPADWPQLAKFLNAGYDAVKAVFPSALVVTHLAGGADNSTFRWWFQNAAANGIKFDAMGMSYYPDSSTWNTTNQQLLANAQDMINTYHKPIVVSEVGMGWWLPTDTNTMLTDLIKKVKSLGSNGLGVFYWEPQSSPGWNGGYNKGALNQAQQFTTALDAFLK